MKDQSEIRPETLNAYVDGELDPAQAARVARVAAGNPSVAAQIATLRELKAAVASAVPDREIRLSGGGPSFHRIMYAAAAVVAFLVGGAVLHLSAFREDSGARWARFLQAQHADWTFSDGSRTAPIAPVFGPANLLPLDLRSARLTFVGSETVHHEGRAVLRAGYEGTRGCRVSLYVFDSDAVPDTTKFDPSLRVRWWEIGEQDFVLLARGMAEARFDGLAKAIEKALRSGYELDRRTRQQLAQARRTSPPCRA